MTLRRLRLLTAGESHGPGLSGILEGLPADLRVSTAKVDEELARRQHGYGSGRRMQIERDRVQWTAGLRFGRTLGSPLAFSIANRDWANWDEFRRLEKLGLTMFGQMTAGSWIYIGTQGIVQGTYETFAEAGRRHYEGDLRGRWILTGGLGGMGGAQPLAAVMAGACCLAVECNPASIDFRLRTRYLDERTDSLDEALEMIERAVAARPDSGYIVDNRQGQ